MTSVPNHFRVCFYSVQTSSAQQNSPNFTLNGMNAVSFPFLSTPGYLPFSAPLVTAPPSTALENAWSPQYAGNGHAIQPFPLADAPSVGAVDYSEPLWFSILGSGIGEQLSAVSSSEDEASLAVAGVDLSIPEESQEDIPTVSPQASPFLGSTMGEPSTSSRHVYRRLPATDQYIVDEQLRPCMMADKKAYKCIWPNCPKKPFMRRCSARTHVHKHLGDFKLFECVACRAQFASEDTARRHRNSQMKTFPCGYWTFARKDHRKAHQQASCDMRNSSLGLSGE